MQKTKRKFYYHDEKSFNCVFVINFDFLTTGSFVIGVSSIAFGAFDVDCKYFPTPVQTATGAENRDKIIKIKQFYENETISEKNPKTL